MDERATLKEVLGEYDLTPAIVSAVKLIFKNPYESLIRFLRHRVESYAVHPRASCSSAVGSRFDRSLCGGNCCG